jgi:hypothetical protein
VRVVLQIRSGPLAGREAAIEPGRALRVGRTDKAELVVAADARLSGAHFAVENGEGGARLRDLASRGGTLLNGERVDEARLRDGDRIRAGDTAFVVRFHDEAAPEPISPPEAEPAVGPDVRLLQILRAEPTPLFALLDAARGDEVRGLIRGCPEETASLYDGVQGKVLEEYAPHLVRLPAGSPFLDVLVREGWGRSAGVYLTSRRPFKEVRRHLRRFLMVREEETDTELYFRFYDPRVLRVFLPTCTPRQAGVFFGEVDRFLLEDADPAVLLRFSPSPSGEGAEREAVALE